MRNRSRKNNNDINIIASRIVGTTTETTTELPAHTKNPAAVALGRLGGKKGGPARAKKLSAIKRKKIAQKAAMARWGKKK
jgi:hypothetical protein